MSTTKKHGKGKPKPLGKDYTKYSFNGETFGKSRLVHAVVKFFATKKKKDISNLFPKKETGAVFEVVTPVRKAEKGRYFLDKEDLIQTANGKFAVTNQWGKQNIDNFIEFVNDLGLNVSKLHSRQHKVA
jgi:hypothetical protein